MTEIKTSTPREAFDLLMVGNQRFAAGTGEHSRQDAARRAETASSQHPFAVVFACSDSRLPAAKVAAGRTALVGLRYSLTDGSAQFVVSHGLDAMASAAS